MIKIAQYIYTQTEIEVFTLWGLSTENLTNRSQQELGYLFDLYRQITENLYELFRQEKVNFRVAGDMEGLPHDLVSFLEQKQDEFSYPESKKTFVLAVNYGGQDEILRAMKKLVASGDVISKENLEKYSDF
jgi:hypothetical protein